MYAAVKAANPNWKPGQKFDTSILDNVTRESVEAILVKNGNRLVRNSIDVSVQNTTTSYLNKRDSIRLDSQDFTYSKGSYVSGK